MTDNPWTAGRVLALPGHGPRLLFGRMYEDPRVEARAFPAAPARVLCVASAGDTAAALARAGYDVTAVDVNPVQLAYARARVDEGAPAAPGSAELMLAAARRATAAALPGWRAPALHEFLDLDDPCTQSRWWRTRLDGPGLRLLMGMALRPVGVLAAALAPGFRHVVPARFDTELRTRVARVVARHPNADNPLLAGLLAGRAPKPRAKAPDLPGTVRFVLGDVAEHLEAVPAGAYDAVTLSNVLDGPGPAYRRRLRTAVERAVRPGGTAVLRSVGGTGGTTAAVRAAEERCPLWGSLYVTTIGGTR
ncbi:class I SAM-dependent methyltransferase [Nocardiopsis halotolerans]|uniref:class I SAM-dependent methyltransferase n=1 Tax=Nocardiopsis halotolerans TaxID=124252 RepID=UPI00034676CA|nr:class I SAM-dependent methyltransferase [Nocardiopsis halotolerans]